MISDLLKKLTGAKSAAAAGLDVVDAIREGIAEKKREIMALQGAPRPVAEALEAFEAWADREATRAVDALALRALLEPAGQADALRLPFVTLPGQVVPNTQFAAEVLLGLIVLTSRDKIRETVRGQLEDHVAGVETLTAAERVKKIERAKRELADAEASEEQAIRQLEQAGLTVSRRPDANPAAVLAADASLPA